MTNMKLNDMTDEELDAFLVENGAEGAGYFRSPNYSTAIVGLAENKHGEVVVVYNYELMADYLEEHDGMTRDDAIDWIDFNVVRSVPYMGEQAPIIFYPFE